MPGKRESLEEGLIESLRQAVAIKQGKEKPSRAYSLPMTTRNAPKIPDAPAYSAKQIAAIRERVGASQPVFARYLGVSAGTLRSWEQGDKAPTGSARRLLQFAFNSPKDFVATIEKSDKVSEKMTSSRKVARKLVRAAKTRKQLGTRA